MSNEYGVRVNLERGSFFPTVARAIINTTVGRSPSNVGKEKPKVNACCLGSTGLFLHLRLTPVEWQGETEEIPKEPKVER